MTVRTSHVGAWGRGRVHLGVMKRSTRFELVALVDTDPENLELGRQLAGLAPDRCHGTLRDALDAHDVDAVVVATPAVHHAQAIDEALAAGKHVLVEKPFTTSLADAERAVDTARERGLQIVVAQNDRLQPAHRTTRRLIAEQAYGAPGYAVLTHHKARRRPYATSPHMHLWQQGVHQLDTLLAVLQRRPLRVQSLSSDPAYGSWPTPSLVHAIIEFEGDVTASYVGTSQARHNDLTLTVECANGSLTSTGPALADSLRLTIGDDSEQLPLDERPGGRSDEEQIADFFWTQITTGTPTELAGEYNLETIRLVEAIQRASESGAPVSL